MSHKHATLDPTTRAPPIEYSSNSRSRSRSRARFQRSSHESDPLLSNLSPTSTLEALSYPDFRPAETRKASSELQESIATASSSERALGIRAASAAKKLKEWYGEVSGWAWPGATEDKNGFEVPSVEDLGPDHETAELGGHGSDEPVEHALMDKEPEYWGSLPRQVVEEYEERIEVIADGMEALDVEELKSHVLEAHMPSTSRSASISNEREWSVDTTSHNHLDDFTAVVTATILQALPYVARLSILLHTWSVRCVVLRQVPGFLRALEDSSTALTSGWSTISTSGASTPGHGSGISREAFNVMQPILENRLTAAGQRLDRMLDALEGREDTVPKRWIDDMAELEADYSNWVVEAEKRVLDNELRQYREERNELLDQPTNTKVVAQVELKPSEHSPVTQDLSTERSPREAYQGESNEVHPLQLTSELPKMSEGTDLVTGPSTPNFRQSNKESSVFKLVDEEIPDEVEKDLIKDGLKVLPPKTKLTPSGQSPLSVPASSIPVSTAKDMVSSLHLAGTETSSSIKDRQLLASAYNATNHQSEDPSATEVRQHCKPEPDKRKHNLESSHQVDSTLPTDRQDSKGPQPVQDVEPRILTSESLPLISMDSPPKVLVQDISQTDGIIEYDISKANLDEYINQRSSNGWNDHGSEKDSFDRNNRITRPGSTIVSEPAHTSRPGSLSEDSHPAPPSEDIPSLSLDKAPGISSNTTVATATSLLMPGSWDDEGIDTGATQDHTKLTSPSSDIVEPKTLTEPGTANTPPRHGGVGEDGQKHTDTAESIATERRLGKPTALTLRPHIIHANQATSSDSSQPGSATSDLYSNASTPELWDARAARSFGKPVQVTSPTKSSDKGGHARLSSDISSPSQRTVRAIDDLPRPGNLRASTMPVVQRDRSSSFAREPTIHEDPISRYNEALNHEGGEGDAEMRRASVTSIEVLSRNEVKSINVRRRSGSYSSPQPMPSSPISEASGLRTPTSSLRQIHNTNAFQDGIQSGSPLSPLVQTSNEEELSPLMRKSKQRDEELGGQKTNPTSLSVLKRSARPTPSLSRSQDSRVRSWRRGASEPLSDDASRVNKATQISAPTKSTEDQLEEKISCILTTIPARIRLTSGPGANAPEVVRPRSLSGAKRPGMLSSVMHSSRNSGEEPSLTLAPAFAKSSPSPASPGESEVRLYHLHQVGKDVPIKLYVRLVGEYGERVMVRVGGGWADLGEYLKEYANHHGRRSVSDGRFEIKGLSPGHSTSSVTTLAGLSTTPTSRPGSALGRPASAFNVRRSRVSSSSPADFAIPSTPDQPFTTSHDMTPGSTESYNTSVRPSSRSSWTGEDAPLGMAGPKSRRIDVSPGKQAWVDGMVEQAKRASAERRKTDENFFGDLGKVGGTKRVFMRSSKEV